MAIRHGSCREGRFSDSSGDSLAVKPILRMGDPRLREIAAPVTRFDTEELHALVADMLDTMQANDGAGLAAIQIGVMLRVVIFGLERNPRYPDAEPVPLTVLVNPQITPLGPEREAGWEGCLSVPGMRGLVPRFKRVRYTGYDASGRPIDRDVAGFHARVVQHECDHLDGILYPQRLEDLTAFGFSEELAASGALVRPAAPREDTSALAFGDG
jgi:peptide deformylase